ncbi:MAG: hypothetical protein LUC97_08995 [Clostridiales bacterium]|nr:hypothetical protein [Clostridiales bacterium]
MSRMRDAAGSAIGSGNIRSFPYLAAKDGGGVFLLCCLIFVLTFGFSLLTTEVAIGSRVTKYLVSFTLGGGTDADGFSQILYQRKFLLLYIWLYFWE